MIRFLLLTRDRWAWQRQCGAECCLFAEHWVEYPPKPVPVTCSSRLPPGRTIIRRATVAILDHKNIPQTDPCAARRTIQNP
jgi:hypothetical protein